MSFDLRPEAGTDKDVTASEVSANLIIGIKQQDPYQCCDIDMDPVVAKPLLRVAAKAAVTVVCAHCRSNWCLLGASAVQVRGDSLAM